MGSIIIKQIARWLYLSRMKNVVMGVSLEFPIPRMAFYGLFIEDILQPLQIGRKVQIWLQIDRKQMPADSSNGICADSSNGKVPNWLEVPSLSASTWKIMEMSNNFLLTSTIFKVLGSYDPLYSLCVGFFSFKWTRTTSSKRTK